MTEEQSEFISELNDHIHADIAKWAKNLIDEGRSIKDIKVMLQRMVDMCEI